MPTPTRFTLLVALTLFPAAAADLAFQAHVIESDIPGGYQLAIADLNRDGRLDVIGLSGRGETLYWYENPSWTRRAVVQGMHRMINLDAADLDGDGVPEIALGTHFGQTDESSEGRVYILRHNGDPTEAWQAQEIDRLPTTHRMRFVDIDSDGAVELVNSPLTGPGCRGPRFECETPLVYYETSDWKRREIPEARLDGVVHGMREADWQGPALLTASMAGVVRFRLGSDGRWERRRLVAGDPAARPSNGSSEIRLGSLDGQRFLTTIEPWHGDKVVVYRHASGGAWPRQVIDDTLADGHALETADFDGDGNDEILSGFRGEGARLSLYRNEQGAWKRQVIDDGGMAAAGCGVADLDADGDLDIVCIGASTANIKWYENRAR